MDYKRFVEDAIDNYQTLPVETIDLYKRYSVAIPTITLDEKSDSNGVEDFAKSVEAKTNIKFDVVVSDSFSKSNNDAIKIIEAKDIKADFLDEKMCKSSDDKLAAFANAYSKYFIFIDTKDARKINMLFINKKQLPVQIIVNVGKKSKLDLFEYYLSSTNEESIVAPLHEIKVMDGGYLELDMLHNENELTNVAGFSRAVVEKDAKLSMNFMYNGALITKAKNIVDVVGEKGSAEINELTIGSGEQKFDINTFITNVNPFTHATLATGSVLDGNSRSMLKGYAKVSKGAKGAKSHIEERGILLSQNAHIDALPDMAIDFSDQVSATHSAATAPIDKEALFYLASRGLGENVARKLFVAAFVSRYLKGVKNYVVKELATSIMLDKVDTGEFGKITSMSLKDMWLASSKFGQSG